VRGRTLGGSRGSPPPPCTSGASGDVGVHRCGEVAEVKVCDVNFTGELDERSEG
jgi:hypothetical protein